MPLDGEYAPSTEQYVRDQVQLYESSGGMQGTGADMGLQIVLMTSRGARSGKLRKTPVMRVEHGGLYAVVGSKAGADESPAWCENLRADPHVELRDGPVVSERQARELAGEERAEWWGRAVLSYPTYAEYQALTERQIPVFVLEPWQDRS
jgi:deazaflavin-dependent oxidoreductase (nitroreductase family)